MYVCMYVCMYVRMYTKMSGAPIGYIDDVCMYVCMHVCMHIDVCMYVRKKALLKIGPFRLEMDGLIMYSTCKCLSRYVCRPSPRE